ncbi:conserved exported protein of unknown function [Candidatus Filomicrobium marinum]|uniref:Uncharacterized protein n=2 Tax=Filomicrobium TaxID=119044 RepID=A0A0D6JIQ2_9HYPH|nr:MULTISPECIES: hypothetical protein [Filomicrobium]MCV0370960.1 hypothetical protein [Filomicrobium sp.]CFX34090.1 conserved exported protein of unknown function [Candidatus Filomicrobium marinum]CPR21879.1 conserved exported protein of unknown function [Candidatus Filomicrobium marinum]SDP50030.1 hypothetical protein SAMN04488061_3197 [Filomicrobium insigne]
MIKRIVLAVAAGLLVSSPAFAQDVAANVDDCLKQAFDLAQSAEEKNLPDAKLDKLEELLTTMEGHCDSNKFDEAATVAGQIKTEIETP